MFTFPELTECVSTESNVSNASSSADTITFDFNDDSNIKERVNITEDHQLHSMMQEILKQEKELKKDVTIQYLQKPNINVLIKQRNDLIKIIYYIYNEYNFSRLTYFLSINMVDRVLNECNITDFDAILLGTSIIHLASKYYEIDSINSPTHKLLMNSNYMYNGYNLMEQMINLEKDIISALNYKISVPNAYNVAQILLKYHYKYHNKLSKITKTEQFSENVYLYLEECIKIPAFKTMVPSKLAKNAIKLFIKDYKLYL